MKGSYTCSLSLSKGGETISLLWLQSQVNHAPFLKKDNPVLTEIYKPTLI